MCAANSGEFVCYYALDAFILTLYPLTAKLFNLNFHPIEVVSR